MADGTVGPLYIETSKPYPLEIVKNFLLISSLNIFLSKQNRRGETGTIAFLEYSFSKKTFVPNDYIISDNEASFKTELVKEIEKGNVTF